MSLKNRKKISLNFRQEKYLTTKTNNNGNFKNNINKQKMNYRVKIKLDKDNTCILFVSSKFSLDRFLLFTAFLLSKFPKISVV